MNAGRVQVLVILDANPAYALPRAFGFTEALAKVPFKVAITQFLDETAEGCDLILADNAPLESWGDWAPRPGVASLQQPTIQPLHDTRQAMDILIQTARALGAKPGAAAAGAPAAATALENVQATGSGCTRRPAPGFEPWWRRTLAKEAFSRAPGRRDLGDVSG
jgi:anaerobic selenocysteine-containing dehydrogenase